MEQKSFWIDRNVFVTGGTGFVGGWLTRALIDKGACVVMLVRDQLPEAHPLGASVVFGDVRNVGLMKRIVNEYEVETVFHLAAQAVVAKANEYPAETLDTNINGTIAVLEAVRSVRPHCKAIVASSDKAYGDSNLLPYVEDAPLEGRNPYDCSKSCADLIAQSYLQYFDLNVAISRSGNVYGGGDLNFNRLIPGTIRRLMRGQTPTIWGSGEETRDYFYVQDAVAAYLRLAECDAQGPYNFSYGKEYTVRETICAICDIMDKPYHPTVLGRTKGEINYQYLDSSRARDELGWKPEYDFETGLQEAVEWYKAYLA